ncbi:F0F1 ATP synthase subunit epsilon [Acidimangrovimonas pyrenivorans]|uniref:ATP synthase epsilon chain n=1 Tax=Acidimangrovimonas pyrenivorans TaxID=2030798 RepID=A0ABV7AGW9_9RHOB
MTSQPVLRLEVFTPGARIVEAEARKVVAEGAQGVFALLPRHIDMVTALRPGLLSYLAEDGTEHFLGIDEGILVKCGDAVQVSVLGAVASDDLETLRAEVTRRFLSLDDSERAARTALARLEAGAIRGVMEIEL